MSNDFQAAGSCCSTKAINPAAMGNGRQNLMDISAASPATPSDDMTTCPIMVGSPVSKSAAEAVGLYRDFEGERFYFCCAGCGPAFDSNPAKYAGDFAAAQA
ncbi:YHS domain-containing protein [Galactobacter caseinivorans]|uniref:YHS domain-containing protein n=1 Tax=Galactobacter caseinivorans TaxID=2676123 RepID=A0A496PKJ2_9MICC|nr:YHS domain-containing protein [Galactobacter caseinivorans]RKW70960.1 YHS domain-containing protein [Galactobacter caseinivorans]